MRMSVDEAFQVAERILKEKTKIRKEERDIAKGILNQSQQDLQRRVAALANDVVASANYKQHEASKDFMLKIAEEIHDLTREGK